MHKGEEILQFIEGSADNGVVFKDGNGNLICLRSDRFEKYK
jgi:hypothetical protein